MGHLPIDIYSCFMGCLHSAADFLGPEGGVVDLRWLDIQAGC
jgi:hypothetical protein